MAIGAPPSDVPVLVVWALLLGSALLVTAAAGLLAWAQRRRDTGQDRAALRAEAGELGRHAAAVTAQAERSAAVLAAARARRAAAEQDRDAARDAHDRAQRRYEESWRAVQEGRRQRPRQATGATGTRDVSRAALAAYRRGELSVDQMKEVWLRADGLDPRQEERERAADRAASAERQARQAYSRSLTAARAARQEAEVAEVAARALADEAVAARQEAGEAAADLGRRRERRHWRPRLGG